MISQKNASSTAKMLGITFENDVYGAQKMKQNLAEMQDTAISFMRDDEVH